jgi:hypothetical protein
MARYKLPSLCTYEEASEKEKTTKPIRGRTPECKPIGDRKDTGFTIRREVDESIVAKCCSSDLIRWYPDGRIFITNGGWPSLTTHDFISRLLGSRYGSRYGPRYGSYCCAYDGATWVRTRDGVYPLAKGGQFFTRHADGYLIAETPNYPVTHQINKSAMREARKKIAPFVKYFNNMMKLTQWAPMGAAAVGRLPPAECHAAMLSNDTEEWARVMTWLVREGTVARWGYDPVTMRPNPNHYISKSVIRERITHTLLATHRSKLLTKKTHTDGNWHKDAYKAYVDD